MIFHNLIVLDFISKFVYYSINISIDYFIILISIATIGVIIVLFSGRKIIGKFVEGGAFGTGAWLAEQGLDKVFGDNSAGSQGGSQANPQGEQGQGQVPQDQGSEVQEVANPQTEEVSKTQGPEGEAVGEQAQGGEGQGEVQGKS